LLFEYSSCRTVIRTRGAVSKNSRSPSSQRGRDRD
jgi:hypothetical protein